MIETLIHTQTLTASPWRNGGGSTRNVVSEPPGAGFDDFLWRVSIANVEAPGPFSVFPGIDRIIVLLNGNGLVLRTSGQTPFHLNTLFEPFAFPGEAAMHASLIEGPTRDLNIMSRRGVATAAVTVWRSSGRLDGSAEHAVFLCARGAFQIPPAVLQEGDAFQISKPAPGMPIVAETPDAILIGAFFNPIA